MSGQYLRHFPPPLLDDLVNGQWLPLVGAGLSCNAALSKGATIPDWAGLAKALAREMSDEEYASSTDVISAYAHEYSRAKLVERLYSLLLIEQARPGEAHRAFCAIPFDIVCTTNWDFLLERAYADNSRSCRPVMDEEQLPISSTGSTLLLKLHGDLHHPGRLVMTEEDYDLFLETYPLLATYFANLLITRTAVLIGYSLDDPDLRQVWQVLGKRLGQLQRPAYAIIVDPRPGEVSRFSRRGVKVVALPGSRAGRGQILAQAFDELAGYWNDSFSSRVEVTEEDPRGELALPSDVKTRLCHFAVPVSLLSFYREFVFPIARHFGFVPVTALDVVSPGDTVVAKVSALIERAGAVVADASNPNTVAELTLALSKLGPSKVFVVAERGTPVPTLADVPVYLRSPDPFDDPGVLVQYIEEWFQSIAAGLARELSEEPERLLALGHFEASVIRAMTLLETTLWRRLEELGEPLARPRTLTALLSLAQGRCMIGQAVAEKAMAWWMVRNAVVHTHHTLRSREAREIVEGVRRAVADLEAHPRPESASK